MGTDKRIVLEILKQDFQGNEEVEVFRKAFENADEWNFADFTGNIDREKAFSAIESKIKNQNTLKDVLTKISEAGIARFPPTKLKELQIILPPKSEEERDLLKNRAMERLGLKKEEKGLSTEVKMSNNIVDGAEMINLEWDDNNIYDYFEKREFFFPKEIITRYFLSLKTKPFVILTGISGTGKTKIAQIFADYLCQDDDPEDRKKRVAFISVRPDWMDNKGLLGYYNLLDEKYHVTPLLNLLLEAERNPSKPYFVVLDEMNLAKVEQYFSDFLSIMESRTPNNPVGEPIELCSAKDLISQGGISIPSKTCIPPNIYFTGTVNVDESTYMFSPKVLDRANVIEFNEIDLENYSKGFEPSEKLILVNQDVRSSLFDKDVPGFCSRSDYAKVKAIMGDKGAVFQELLDILHPYNLHFGYRVINEISRFILNAKELVKDFNLDDSLDIQLLQKILPKFHGSQARIYDPLAKLLGYCYSGEAKLSEIPSQGEIDKDIEKGLLRFPRSARKLSRMLWNLKVQGYTSFID